MLYNMAMHEMVETIQNLSVNTAYACAAAVGAVVVSYGISRVAKLIASGERKLAAVSLGAALMVGGLAVVGTDDAGTKPGTNVVNQAECGTNTVGQTDGGTNNWTNIAGTNTVGQAGGEGTNGTGLVLGPLMLGRFGQPNLMQGQPPAITDEDIEFGWRVASVSSNVLAAANFTMPPNATVWESAQASGRGWGAWRIPLDGWHFTYGDVGWTNGFAWVEGYFRSQFNSRANEIRLLSERLTLCPAANWSRYNLNASRAWCATNGEDGLIVTFEGAAVGDDPTKIANVQMELFPRTGEVALRYDLANVGDATYTAGLVIDGTNRFVEVGAGTREVVFQRVHPDDWDMDGIPNSIDDTPRESLPSTGYNQTDAWAMAAFPSNSAEIAAMGYAAWAAARATDPNRRLIGLHISSPNSAWPVCLTFGEKQVMCDGNTEIVFAIDCGARYQFSISGDGELEFFTLHGEVDDTQPCAAYGYPYERWANDVVAHMESPSSGWIERAAEVSVDGLEDMHLFPDDGKIVTAVVTNCHEDAYIGCTWSGGDGVSFSDCHSLETEVFWHDAGTADWATNSLTIVTEYVGGHVVTNIYIFTVGVHAEPNTDFSVSLGTVLFVNEDDRRERVYPVVASLLAARNKKASISFTSGGEPCPALFWDEGATIPYEGDEFPLREPDSNIWFNECRLYVKASDVGNGMISATCTVSNQVSSVDGGHEGEEASSAEVYSTNCSFRVVEPIRKLVTNQLGANGQYLNPSRLVVGSNAVLSVEARGPISASEVHWNIAGPGLITQTNGWNVTVVPTAGSGTVTVEARFNDDAIQPTFVLPIVHERVLNVKVFAVSSAGGDAAIQKEDADAKFEEVNRIFHQVGIRFNLAGYMQLPNSSQYWDLPIQEVRSHFWGGDELVDSEQLIQLLGTYQRMSDYRESDCIEMYVVKSFIPADAGGLCGPGDGIVVPADITAPLLAHELGHALGLLDCYQSKELDENNPAEGSMSLPTDTLSEACFQSRPNDWGMETGCGFYPLTETITGIYARLLMNGKVVVGGITGLDIPDGAVWCVMGHAFGATGIGFSPVGASNILQSNEQVYTK